MLGGAISGARFDARLKRNQNALFDRVCCEICEIFRELASRALLDIGEASVMLRK